MRECTDNLVTASMGAFQSLFQRWTACFMGSPAMYLPAPPPDLLSHLFQLLGQWQRFCTAEPPSWWGLQVQLMQGTAEASLRCVVEPCFRDVQIPDFYLLSRP